MLKDKEFDKKVMIGRDKFLEHAMEWKEEYEYYSKAVKKNGSILRLGSN